MGSTGLNVYIWIGLEKKEEISCKRNNFGENRVAMGITYWMEEIQGIIYYYNSIYNRDCRRECLYRLDQGLQDISKRVLCAF